LSAHRSDTVASESTYRRVVRAASKCHFNRENPDGAFLLECMRPRRQGPPASRATPPVVFVAFDACPKRALPRWLASPSRDREAMSPDISTVLGVLSRGTPSERANPLSDFSARGKRQGGCQPETCPNRGGNHNAIVNSSAVPRNPIPVGWPGQKQAGDTSETFLVCNRIFHGESVKQTRKKKKKHVPI